MVTKHKLLSSVEFLFIAFFIFIILAFTFHDLYFSTDPYDETFYLAIPYRFILGGKSFIDEYSLAQTSAWFTYPFFKLYYLLQGSIDGIILFSRYLYTCVFLCLGVFIFFVTKKIVSKNAAAIIALTPIAYVPFNIHGLSYNTLSTLFITLGLFLGFQQIALKNDNATRNSINWQIFGGGILLTCAAFCYPPFILVTIIYLFILLYLQLDKIQILSYIFGVALVSLFILLFIFSVGLQQLLIAHHYVSSFGVQGGGLSKIKEVFITIFNEFPNKKIIFYLFLAQIIIRRFWKFPLFIIVITVSYLLINPGLKTGDSMYFIRNVGLIAPLLFLFLPKTKMNSLLLILIWLPSFIGGAISAWSSSNGANNFVIGGFPMAIVAMIYIYKTLDMVLNEIKNDWIKETIRLCAIISIVMIVWTLEYATSSHNYGDLPNNQLHAKISGGPFSNIYTTAAKRDFYEELQKNLKIASLQANSILFFDSFPAGYLFSQLMPNTNTVWIVSKFKFPHYDREATLKYYQMKNTYPDIIVKMKGIPENSNPIAYSYQYAKDDPFNSLIRKYHVLISNPYYVIFQKN